MNWIRLKHLALVLTVILLPVTLPTGAMPKTEVAPQSSSLAGQLLIASPEMGDPRFYHAVVLVVQHDNEGALGIMINRPVEERSLASLLEAIGERDMGVEGSVRIFAGGPVEPRRGFVVHSADYRRAETLDIDGRVAMTGSPEILRDIGHNRGPKKALVAFGYTGWGPGQLESELAQHGWFTTPEDPKLIFDEDRGRVWEDAMTRRTVPL